MALLCVPALLVAFAGCSGKDKDKSDDKGKDTSGSGSSVSSDDIKYFGIALVGYADFKEKAPTSIDDILALKATADLPKKTVELVRSGDIVGVWNVNFTKYRATKDLDDHVIAYEKDAPTRGGWVMMGIKNPEKVTAEEFKKLKLAK
jgi:hypothetical protein